MLLKLAPGPKMQGTYFAVVGPDGGVLALFQYGDWASRWREVNYPDGDRVQLLEVVLRP